MQKMICVIVFILISCNSVYANKISDFKIVLDEFGLSDSGKNKMDLVNLLYLANIINDKDKIRESLKALGKESENDLIIKILDKANTFQSDFEKFDANYVIDNLFTSNDFEQQDIRDLVLYWFQYLFQRKKFQERDAISHQNQINIDACANILRDLGFIDRKDPSYNRYDEIWVLGATRLGMLARLVDLNHVINKFDIKYDVIKILTGDREIWAEFDGIEPTLYGALLRLYEDKAPIENLSREHKVTYNQDTLEEGKLYIRELCKKNNIKLHDDNPFIKYDKDVTQGRFINRTYPNYIDDKQNIATEALVVEDLCDTLSLKCEIVNAKSKSHRPNTEDTIIQALKDMKNTPSKILVYTNNPYIPRQFFLTKFHVNKLFPDIMVDSAGFPNKQDIQIVLSEFAGYIAQVYQLNTTDPKRDINSLLYSTRP